MSLRLCEQKNENLKCLGFENCKAEVPYLTTQIQSFNLVGKMEVMGSIIIIAEFMTVC